jgi:DNA-directed RNA polymerase specialized sigma24 family protein
MNRPEFPFARPPAESATDAELSQALHACARHNVAALRRIYELTAPRLLAELLQLLDNRKAAEAALVNCFIGIWNDAGNFNPQRSHPRAWLLSIARHHAIGLLRETPARAADEVDSALSFLHAVLHEEGVPQQQLLLRLVWRSGRSLAEVARALAVPLRHVRQEIRDSMDAMSRQPS